MHLKYLLFFHIDDHLLYFQFGCIGLAILGILVGFWARLPKLEHFRHKCIRAVGLGHSDGEGGDNLEN